MAEKRGYTISDTYQGGFSTLNPPENKYMSDSPNASISTGSFGMTTDPRNANILQEVSSKLSMGVKNIEIEAVMPEVFDSIPKQQLKEVNRLTKLTGIDVSLHGPVSGMNVAGIGQQGFNESTREENEKKVIHTLLRAKELRPNGNIPVNFHTSEGLPMSQLLPPGKRKPGEDYKKLLVINKDSGQMTQLETKEEFYPGGEKGVVSRKNTPTQRIKNLNETEWHNSLNQMFFNQERLKEVLDSTKPFLKHLQDPETGRIDIDLKNFPSETQAQIKQKFDTAGSYLEDLHQQANGFFSKAYEFGTENERKELANLNENFTKKLQQDPGFYGQASAMQFLIGELKEKKHTPQLWTSLEEFATEKTTQTFGNAAFETYKKLNGKNVPVLIIENPPAGQALSTGKDVKNVVKGSRKQFIKRAVKEGMSRNKAEKEAEKLIGATWDVGHINMLRKYGYKEEDIVKESEEVAPFIKHVHLSDNFGFEHTELPMGMGNVPLKEIMEKLGEKGYEAAKIIEAGHYINQFKKSPFQESLQLMGSPIYGMKMSPYWSQSNELQEGYFGGYGDMLPQMNYQLFGAGFSQLPKELGGSVQGAQGSRMSGRPMQ